MDWYLIAKIALPLIAGVVFVYLCRPRSRYPDEL
jgi:hypothetical protein